MMSFTRLFCCAGIWLASAVALPLLEAGAQLALPFTAQDPGPRLTPSRNGAPFEGLTPVQHQLFINGHQVFNAAATVQGTLPGTRPGLGPRFNMDSCAGCHGHPHLGGTSQMLN